MLSAPTIIEQTFALATVNFRLLVKEKAKIQRSHERVFNGLVVDIQQFAEQLS
jgi:hypothetical protein